MTARNLHRISGALARLQHEAATGSCFLSRCDNPAAGYIQGSSNRPVGVCEAHRDAAETRGYHVYTDPLPVAASEAAGIPVLVHREDT